MEENHNSITHGVQHPGIHRFASPKFDPSIVYKKRWGAYRQMHSAAIMLLCCCTRQPANISTTTVCYLLYSTLVCSAENHLLPLLFVLLRSYFILPFTIYICTYDELKKAKCYHMHYSSLTLVSACVSISAAEGCAVLAPCCKQGVSSVEMYVMIMMVILVQLMMMMNLNKRLVFLCCMQAVCILKHNVYVLSSH